MRNQNRASIVESLVDENGSGRKRDGCHHRGHERGRLVRHEPLKLVLVARRVLGEDGAGLKSTTANVKHECLFWLYGQTVRGEVDAL